MRRRRDSRNEDGPGRTDPTLGDLDQLDTDDPRVDAADGLPSVRGDARDADARPGAPGRRHRRAWLVGVLVVLAAAFAAIWVNQGHLRNLVPQTTLNEVLDRADQALADGRLDGADGTSARELYQAVLAMQPDNDAAHAGLERVGHALVADADTALRAGHLDQAERDAATARQLLGGGSDLDRLDQAILAARAPGPATPALVERAQRALANGTLDGADGAIALYREIARADPGSAVARHGLDQAGAALATQARQALAAHDIAQADARIEQLAALQPTNGALPGLRAARAEALAAPAGSSAAPQTADVESAAAPPPQAPPAAPAPAPVDHAAVAREVAQGQAALRAGRISGAGDDTALAHFRKAAELDPDDADARAGLDNVARALVVRANAATDAGDPAQAAQLLNEAAALAPQSLGLAAARTHLARAQRPGAGAAAGNYAAPPVAPDAPAMAAPMQLTAQQRAKIGELVQAAQAATQRGDILLPPGECAYDLYRSALAINGNDPSALAGMAALPGAVEQLFGQALAAGNLTRANNMLGSYAELVPDGGQQAAMKARLVGAWLDRATQELAQGNRPAATQSLERARKLAPGDPRVAQLGARIANS